MMCDIISSLFFSIYLYVSKQQLSFPWEYPCKQ